MENVKDFYITGKPIKTKIGDLHFIKVEDYYDFLQYTPFLNLQKFEVINKIKKLDSTLADTMNELDFLTLIKYSGQAFGLRQTFEELFKMCFKKDVFGLIETNEEFEEYRELIRKINCVPFEVPNPNPEIERFNRLKKLYNQNRNGDSSSFESIYTSLWVTLGEEPCNLTLYQYHSLFNRIGMFKNYETTTMYALMSSEVKVENWYKHIDLLGEQEDKGTTLEDLANEINSKLT